ncbi:MAG: ABC transporter substrate-binding protein [Chloroflexi bacterium]|nr:MAG: ABC transporter substrate-binding protein [Chloroflexota bacterium]
MRAISVGALAVLAISACGLATNGGPAAGKLQVVAAENFWGSIAAQVGAVRVEVTSIIKNPNADPHDYEPTAADARTVARAGYFIENGAGYDPWAAKLVAANPVANRRVLDVGGLVGVSEGGNPHLWYSPGFVDRVVARLAADFGTDPSTYETSGLSDYHSTLAAIREKYSGTPVGATESIFVYVARATGLNLVTPPGYMRAISAGADPTAADKAAVDEQVASRSLKVLVFNAQNSTPDVRAVVDRAEAQRLPVVAITETQAPADLTYQDWQTRQLNALLAALGG